MRFRIILKLDFENSMDNEEIEAFMLSMFTPNTEYDYEIDGEDHVCSFNAVEIERIERPLVTRGSGCPFCDLDLKPYQTPIDGLWVHKGPYNKLIECPLYAQKLAEQPVKNPFKPEGEYFDSLYKALNGVNTTALTSDQMAAIMLLRRAINEGRVTIHAKAD